LKCFSFAVVQQSERVRGCAHRGYPVAAPRLEVAGRGESRDVGASCRSRGAALTGAARTHLGEWPAICRVHHTAGCRCYRRVGIEHAQRECLKQHTLGKARLDSEEWGSWKKHLALWIPPDIARETKVCQPV